MSSQIIKKETKFTLYQGTSYESTPVASKEECLLLCKGDPKCIWFTYFPTFQVCLLYTDCPSIDETCTECLSGEFSCVPVDDVPKGKFLKLLKLIPKT